MELPMRMEYQNIKCRKSIWGYIWFVGGYLIITKEDWEGGGGR